MMILSPIPQTERWGFIFSLIPIRYVNSTNLCALIKISGIHALYVLIEKRFSQFKESQNFRLVNNAKPLLDNITN